MADKKEKPTIHTGVRIDNKVFTPGKEEELAEALTPEAHAHLTKKGAISNFDEPEAPKAKK